MFVELISLVTQGVVAGSMSIGDLVMANSIVQFWIRRDTAPRANRLESSCGHFAVDMRCRCFTYAVFRHKKRRSMTTMWTYALVDPL